MGTLRYVIAIDAPLEKVYLIWSDLGRLRDHFAFLTDIRFGEGDEIIWEYEALIRGKRVVRARITEDVPERILAWRSIENPRNLSGSISLEPAGSKTYMTFVVSYDPPAGRFGDIFANFFGYPSKRLAEALLGFRDRVESPQTESVPIPAASEELAT